MTVQYGYFGWMKPYVLKPHAIQAYPDALDVYKNTYGLNLWFRTCFPPNDDYASWNDPKCRHIESLMNYEHTDASFNDTMLWLKQISTDGWAVWVTEWNKNVTKWGALRPKIGDFRYIKNDNLRDEYETLYHILQKEPYYWSLFMSELFSEDNGAFADFCVLLHMGWEKWIDGQISKTILDGKRRVKKVTISSSCCYCFPWSE